MNGIYRPGVLTIFETSSIPYDRQTQGKKGGGRKKEKTKQNKTMA